MTSAGEIDKHCRWELRGTVFLRLMSHQRCRGMGSVGTRLDPQSSTPLLAHSEHLDVGGLHDLFIFLLRHGSCDRNLMVVCMRRQQFGVAGNNGFLARLFILKHVLARTGTFVEASGDAGLTPTLLFLFLGG